ncbi:MAG: hypothetical protein NVSMB58_37490 [Terriglobales bacterium]
MASNTKQVCSDHNDHVQERLAKGAKVAQADQKETAIRSMNDPRERFAMKTAA